MEVYSSITRQSTRYSFVVSQGLSTSDCLSRNPRLVVHEATSSLGRCSLWKGPETIADLGAGVPNHSELEPSGGVPYRLGGVSEAGGVRTLGTSRPAHSELNTRTRTAALGHLMSRVGLIAFWRSSFDAGDLNPTTSMGIENRLLRGDQEPDDLIGSV